MWESNSCPLKSPRRLRADRQAGRQTGRQTDGRTDERTDRQRDRETDRHRQTERQRDRETDRLLAVTWAVLMRSWAVLKGEEDREARTPARLVWDRGLPSFIFPSV